MHDRQQESGGELSDLGDTPPEEFRKQLYEKWPVAGGA